MQWKYLASLLQFPKRQGCGPVLARPCSQSWDQDGVVMTDFLAEGPTIPGGYYASLWSKLREAIKIKRRGKISKGILLLQHNAQVHISDVARPEALAGMWLWNPSLSMLSHLFSWPIVGRKSTWPSIFNTWSSTRYQKLRTAVAWVGSTFRQFSYNIHVYLHQVRCTSCVLRL